MFMKYISLVILFVLTVVSCSDVQVTEKNLSTNSIGLSGLSESTCFYCDNIENLDNYFDYIGCLHNEGMQQIDADINNLLVYHNDDSLNLQSSLSNVMPWFENFLNIGSTGLDTLKVYNVSLINVIENPFTSLLNLNNSNNFSPQFDQYTLQLWNIVNDTTITDAFDIVNNIKMLESTIINSSLPSTEKDCILIMTSVARYSSVHWINWMNENDIGSIVTKQGDEFQEPKKKKTKCDCKCCNNGQKTAGAIIGADFVGAYVGFLTGILGGPAGMAVGAAAGGLGSSAITALGRM